ncbi:MAG: peroxiredoxin family protein [Bergeyella cardium]
MKKNILLVALALSTQLVNAQFNINIKTEGDNTNKEIYVYTLDGSKDILFTKGQSSKNSFSIKYPTSYSGIMKAYIPEFKTTIPFISENRNIDILLKIKDAKVDDIIYLDEANKLMSKLQSTEKKKDYILPALYQISQYYRKSEEFAQALEKEIHNLSQSEKEDLQSYPFINYYHTNSSKFLQKSIEAPSISQEEIIKFISDSNEMLETSSLLRPLLLSYLNSKENLNAEDAVAKLLTAVNIETSRGQTVLSELIDIFNAYAMNDLKEKYLKDAQNLKCSINSRLENTIKINKSLDIGASFANSDLENTLNTSAKTLYGVKANKKIIIFWSSGCSHCTKELPQFIPHYETLKSKGIEIIGFSLDSNKENYLEKAQNYPWISTSELNGWYASYVQKYNVQATPIYFVLDAKNKIIAKPDRYTDVMEFLGIK